LLHAIFSRTTSRNKEICLAKLKELLAEAEMEPIGHLLRAGMGGEQTRRILKEKRAEIKKDRAQNRHCDTGDLHYDESDDLVLG
jgi:tRNA A22 N-methylase